MCAICWSGGQIIPAAGIAWRYWSVNRLKPAKADRGPHADTDADTDVGDLVEVEVGPVDLDQQHDRSPLGVG